MFDINFPRNLADLMLMDHAKIRGKEMSQQSKAVRLSRSVLVLAASACLALAGCGGGASTSAAASGPGAPSRSVGSAAAPGGSGDSAACAAFATAYKKFLAGHAPPQSETGADETPLRALSDAVAKIAASGQLNQDLADLGIDAGLIATGASEGGQTVSPSAFTSDLQAVGKDCGTTFAQPPAALVVEG